MRPLWDHQVHAIRVAEVVPDLGLFMEQGTGKTRTMIEIMRRKYAKVNRLQKTLIIAPIIVCENWKHEIKMYSKINPSDVVVLTGSGRSRVDLFLKQVGTDLSKAKIIVTNYEAMLMQDLYKLLMMWEPEILVCDESQRIKNPQSKRAKAVVQLADLTSNNFMLSGTPILNSAMDVFMQYRALDRGKTFGKNYFSFRNLYFVDKNAGMNKQNHFPNWVPRDSTYPELQEKMKKSAIRVLKKDCLDLPPLVRQQVLASLSPAQAKAYKEMYNEYITFIDAHEGPKAVVAQMAITKALRLQQIVTGFAKDENGVVHRLDNPRLAVLEELLESLDPKAKVIIWAVFKENYSMIAELCEKLGRQYREIHGDVPQKAREQNLEDFRKDPDVNTIIMNQGAGGVGINLVEAGYSIYYSKGFKLEDDLQSEARNYRGGSEMHEKVTRIDIVAPGSIDELINEALYNKQQIGNEILGWRERMVL